MPSLRRLRPLAAVTAIALGASLAVTAAAANAASSYSSTVLNDGPIAYWRLGETGGTTAADASGNGHAGTYSGGVSLGSTGAIAADSNSAATFNGSTGQVSIPDTSGLRLNGAFSIELWAKTTSFVNSWPGLLVKGSASTANGYLIWYGSDGTLHFKRNGYDFTTPAGAITSSYKHLVVTYDGTTARWYINGALVRTATVSYPSSTDTSALMLGRGDQYGAEGLDEVALYDKTLSAVQVSAHYSQGVSTASPTPSAGPTSASPSPTPSPTATSPSPSPSPTQTSASPTPTPTVTSASPTPPPGADPVIAAAGDIACDPTDANYNGGAGSKSYCHELATARLITSGGYDRVFALGDEQYADATLDKFQTSYDPSWGQFKSKTVPVPGNHEYLDGNADGYYSYFGAAAGDPTKGYYSFNLGTWHVIVLNGECSYVGGCGAGTPQETWLRADLASHPSTCTLAMWHEPRFASGSGGDTGTGFTTFWTDLYNAGAELLLNGHIHDYERFAPQTPNGTADNARGIREFVVGTGGKSLVGFDRSLPNSQVRNANTYGVLKLTLHPGSYDWQFVHEQGKNFTDSGTTSCH
jgi:acid phosphatase type 7